MKERQPYDRANWEDDADRIRAFRDEANKLGISLKELFRRMWKLWEEKKEEKDEK